MHKFSILLEDWVIIGEKSVFERERGEREEGK